MNDLFWKNLVIKTLVFLVSILLCPFIMVLNGYALSVLWGWFIVPAFNLNPLSIPIAIGIMMIVSYVTHQTDLHKVLKKSYEKKRNIEHIEDTDEYMYSSLFAHLLFGFLKPSLALFFGWIVHLFV
jgi:hypothetical protein